MFIGRSIINLLLNGGYVKIDNRISLRKLEVLCTVVDLGGVHRAAEHLSVSQPVVSRHLHSLQERLGVTLFDRHGRDIRLTEAGQSIHAWAKEVLILRTELAQEIDELSTGAAGAAVVAASPSVGNYLLPAVLSDFAAANPLAQVTLKVFEPETALDTVDSGLADFAVVVTDRPVSAAVFAAEQIAREESILVTSTRDRSVPAKVWVADLAKMPAVCPPRGLTVRRMQDEALRAFGVQQRPVAIEMDGVEATKHAVAAGLGVALLTRAEVAQEIADGRLREVAIYDFRLTQPIYLLKRKRKRLSPLQHALANAIRAHYFVEE
jgi:DNA-binding transcriptional LysR family regulator